MTTITPEERERLRYIYGSDPIPNVLKGVSCIHLIRALDALDAAEARAGSLQAQLNNTVLHSACSTCDVPRLIDELNSARSRAEKAETERDVLAHKFADVSDKMNGHNPPRSFCHACNICPACDDSDLEGRTCEDALREYTAAEAAKRSE